MRKSFVSRQISVGSVAVLFELRDAIALPLPPGSRLGADLVKVSRRSNYLASITVSRDAHEDVGFREVFVQVDGKDVGMLRYGDSISHELPAGPHRIRAHNTLCWKTHDIVLQPGEHARFVAINRAGWGTFGMLMILGAAPVYLTFERAKE
jgi:hypothetical protein